MKIFIVLSVLVAIAVAAPQSSSQRQGEPRPIIPITKFESEQSPTAYRFGYESANGIQVAEQGQVQQDGPNEKDKAVVAEGFFAFRGDDGQEYAVQYVADKDGFRAQGEHLPTPVPLPEENLRLMAEAYARPTTTYDLEEEAEETRNQQPQYKRQY